MRGWSLALFCSVVGLSACGGTAGTGSPTPCCGLPPGETADDLRIDSANAGHLLFVAYRASDLLVRKELLEHLPRQYLDRSYPPCDSGAIAVQFDDNDSNGVLSTGDEIQVTFSNCHYRSANGLGDVQMDGILDFKNITIRPDTDQWTLVAGPSAPVTYSDLASGPGSFSAAWQYDAELDHPTNSPRTLKLPGDTLIKKYLDGKSLFVSGGLQEVDGVNDGSYSVTFEYSIQDDGAFQQTQNPNGTAIYSYTLNGDGRFGPPTGAASTPLQGSFTANGGYPSSGSFRITGATADGSNTFNSTAVLTPQGNSGAVTVEIRLADASGSNYQTYYSEQTTWQAISAGN